MALIDKKFMVHDWYMSINQRIRQRRTELGLTLKDVARLVGLRAWQTVQHWERDAAPARRRMGDVAKALQVSEEWLLTGRGPMQPSLVNAFSELTGNEAQLIMFFRNLSDDEKGKVLRFTHELNEKYRDPFGGTPLNLANTPKNSNKKDQVA